MHDALFVLLGIGHAINIYKMNEVKTIFE